MISSGPCDRTRRARSWETASWGPACPRAESGTESANGCACADGIRPVAAACAGVADGDTSRCSRRGRGSPAPDAGTAASESGNVSAVGRESGDARDHGHGRARFEGGRGESASAFGGACRRSRL